MWGVCFAVIRAFFSKLSPCIHHHTCFSRDFVLSHRFSFSILTTVQVLINYWLMAIPGLLLGSMAGPVINKLIGPRYVLLAFVIILLADIGREIAVIISSAP